jgi:hypothetical protein
MTSRRPGIVCNAKRRPPAAAATTALVAVFAVMAARIGTTASRAESLPAATREAIEIAAACVSAKPATPAASNSPRAPNLWLTAADSMRMAETVAAKRNEDFRSNARPRATGALSDARASRRAKTSP